MNELEKIIHEISEMIRLGESDREINELQKAVRIKWQKQLSDELMHSLYETLITEIDNYLATRKNGAPLYFFVETFSSNNYLQNLSDLTAQNVLVEVSNHLLSRIENLIKCEDEILVKRSPLKFLITRGNLGEMVLNIFELYFYHTSYHQNDLIDNLKKSVSELILPFTRAFPRNGSNLIASFIPFNDNANRLFAEIINQCVIAGDFVEEGLLTNISFRAFSLHVDKQDVEYKKIVHITKELLPMTEFWDSKHIDLFLHRMILYPLSIPISIEEREAYLKSSIADKNNEDDEYFEINEKLRKEAIKELEFLQTEPDKYLNQRIKKAGQKVAVFKNMLKSIEMILKKWPGGTHQILLEKIVTEAYIFSKKPRLFPLNNKPDIIFKDIGFKLMVIEELMYNQKVLTPAFDIYQFVEEYTGRDISVEADGYGIIPEALKYFKNLDITRDQLELVTELSLDGGVDGGAEIYKHLWPFWDPGAGDELIKISKKAIHDVDLLPHLKKITGIENCNPPKTFLKYLNESGVELIEQDI